MRNISKTIAALSLLAPASAHSIGIGDIKLHSALNEKLNAEIALTLDAGENIGDIRVKLAPLEKFDRSGIPWSHFLNKIKFEPVAKSSSLVIVKLTTNDAVTEPFLDFLVEVSSLEGSQYREFTVLVDPPSGYASTMAPATALPAITAKQGSMPRWTADEGLPRERVSRPARRPATVAAVEQPGALRVRRNDTLSKIAARVNSYSDVSDQQMAIALFQANPQAFYRNNINALSAGSSLNVPDKQAILRIDRQQAGAEFKRQNLAWQGGVETESALPPQPAEEAKLTLAAPTETEVGQEAKVTAKPEAQQIPTSGKAAAPGAAALTESVQVQDRVRALEEKLAEMEKRLALKDAQLAALQSGSGVKAEVTPPQPEAAPPQPQNAAPAPEAAQPPETLAPPAPAAPTPQPEAAAPETAAPAQPTPSATPTPAAPVQQPEAAAPPAAPAPATPPKPVVKAQPPAPAPQAEETPVLVYSILGGVGVTLLGAFTWLFLRKRRIEEEQSRESMFASSSQISLPSTDDELLVPNVIDETPNFGLSASASTSSFLNDFGSEFTFFDTDQNEVDPVSEADVYLAYGRYQQAEELIRNAITEQPERDEYKLKLLEIFFTNNNKQSFENYVRELAEAGKKNDMKFWSRVSEMGGEIIPDSPLFSSVKLPGSDFFERPARKEEAGSKQEASAASVGSQAADFSLPELDLEQPNVQAPSEETDTTPADESAALDFDLSSTQTVANKGAGASQASEAKEEFEAFDFNLDADAVQFEDIGELNLSEDAEALESLDSFDFFADSGKTEEAEKSAASEAEDLEKIDFKMPVIETPAASPAISETLEPAKEEKIGFYRLDDMDDTATEDVGGLDFGLDVDLTEMDELETKIDLAKAYIDMGDAEAAREIAEDVLVRGNSEQKREAQAIIDGL